jgi:glycosyltransferase involved in cell wall biosynthesis
LKLVDLRLRFRSKVLHLQVSERLSFVRKGTFIALGKLMGMKVILHHHGAEVAPFYRGASPRMQSFVRWLVQRADINLVLGELWRDLLVREMNASPEKVLVRFNAAHDVGTATSSDVNIDRWQFLIVANLSPRKGVGELLRSVVRLRDEGYPVKLTLAGGGSVQKYRAEAEALGIAEYCTFTGWISPAAIHDLMLSKSALVLPSYQEGFPMAIIEALSARLPVIATPVGSIAELLTSGEDCLLVTPGNVDQLVVALKIVATDEAARRKLIANGRAFYDMNFHIDAYMEKMLKLYSADI